MTASKNPPPGPSPSGTLFVVATPIGNLGDISQRAIETLRNVRLIACEDTRQTRKLLSRLQITTPLTSYYREKEQLKAEILLEKLRQGDDLALVSDAGTPGLSDPGAVLVKLAREAGIAIVPLPGPSALATALSVAGLPDTSFYFGGFLPPKTPQRRKLLQQLATLPCPLIFYESPHRIAACLEDCCAVLGDRSALLFRELTKIHEECLTGTLSQILSQLSTNPRGEMVLIIHAAPALQQEDKPENLEELLRWYKKQPEISLKDAVSRIAGDLDLSRSLVYRKALVIWQE